MEQHFSMLREKIQIIGEYVSDEIDGWDIEGHAHGKYFKCWKSTDNLGVKPFVETPSLEECALKLMCSGYKFDDINLDVLCLSKCDAEDLEKLMSA